MEIHNHDCCTQICNYLIRYKELGRLIEEIRNDSIHNSANFEAVIQMNELIKERTEIRAAVENIIWSD